ncbi:MAG: DUF2220 family protein [Bifidobacterium sp.]|nr:DUF2220 family protein [Bifidobacterium sp.]
MRSARELADAIAAHGERHLFEAADPWPLTVPVRLPGERALEDDATHVFATDNATRRWAGERGVELVMVTRRLGGTPVELVSHVIVPDGATAMRAVSGKVRAHWTLVRERAERLGALTAGWSGVDEEALMRVLKWMDPGLDATREELAASDVDFELLLAAAAWFHDHLDGVPSLTPREVPLEGFSAKWLDGERSRHRRALCALLGVEALDLRERPGEVRYRYLDPAAADWPERLATSVQGSPELPVRRAIIVENKDTYLGLPVMEGTVCVFGSGFAVGHAAELLPWLRECEVVYWGDLDAAGFEILSTLRRSGLSARSVAMDRATYDRFTRFGTTLSATNKPLKPQDPKVGLALTPDERSLYEALCRGELPNPRIEQERIPLAYVLGRID